MRADGNSEETLLFVTCFQNQLQNKDRAQFQSLNNNNNTHIHSINPLLLQAHDDLDLVSVSYLLLFNLGLCVVVDGLLGVR